MENIKVLYEYIQNHSSRHVYKINLAPIAESFIKGLKQARKELGFEEEYDEELEEMFDDLIPQKNTDHEEVEFSKNTHLNNAYKIKNVNLEVGDIKQIDKYIYGYEDLTYDEFCSYLYWRTCIRKKRFVKHQFLFCVCI